jgi:hypothetical protein
VTARITIISRTRRVGGYLRSQAGTDPATGVPTPVWWSDEDALAADAAGDGWYALPSNLHQDDQMVGSY